MDEMKNKKTLRILATKSSDRVETTDQYLHVNRKELREAALSKPHKEINLKMKSPIYWNVTPCGPLTVNRRFAGTCHLLDSNNKARE
jgi:hypothetical protein